MKFLSVCFISTLSVSFICYLLILSICSCNNVEKKESTEKTDYTISEDTVKFRAVDNFFVHSPEITSPYGPRNITRNLIQDRKGNLWLATWQGIIQYDGKLFINHTNKDSLMPYRVFTTFQDSKDNIWFGTIGAGLYKFDGITFMQYTAEDGLIDNRLSCIMEDKNDNLWFGTMGGISRFDGEHFTNFTVDSGLTYNDINAITEDKHGHLWIGTRGTACIFDGQKFTTITHDDSISFGNVRSIIKDQNDNIWLGGNGGLWKYNNTSFKKISSHFVGYIYEDSKGNIWTSSQTDTFTYWALSKYEKSLLGEEFLKPEVILEEENMFFGIIEDNDQNIWLGTLKGVHRYNGRTFNNFRPQK